MNTRNVPEGLRTRQVVHTTPDDLIVLSFEASHVFDGHRVGGPARQNIHLLHLCCGVMCSRTAGGKIIKWHGSWGQIVHADGARSTAYAIRAVELAEEVKCRSKRD